MLLCLSLSDVTTALKLILYHVVKQHAKYLSAQFHILCTEVCLVWPPQSFWLQIQRPGFDSRRYQTFREVVGVERGPLSLVGKIEEILGRKSSNSHLESQEYDSGVLLRWPHNTLYPLKLALTSQTNGSCSVGIVHSWTKATEFSLNMKVSFSKERI
jgi:hypothetical protein